ncbi:unnamed protein product [Linum trigynum]|uniref:Reverse transcriptase zinc-binding domain-containing protein n=1 Tax=Linum trigynum TaxID=586398 RepID=A0AAV2CQX2_9ROSI
MYQGLCREKFPGVANFPFKSVWRLKAPSKVNGFAWLLFHNRTLTHDNLKRRGWNIVSRCVLCEANTETASHLFRSCEYSTRIWDRYMTVLSVGGPFPIDLQQLFGCWCREDPDDWLDWFRYLFLHGFVWEVWKERNERSFKDTSKAWQVIFHKIGRTLLHWIAAAGQINDQNAKDWRRLLALACPPTRNNSI